MPIMLIQGSPDDKDSCIGRLVLKWADDGGLQQIDLNRGWKSLNRR